MTQTRSIRSFALACVALVSVFLMAMAVWYTIMVSGRDWCGRAIGAEEVAEGGTRQRSETAVEACMGLLDKQVSILGINSHMLIGTFALCLLTLMVIVVAGGRLTFKASATGVQGSIDDGAGEAAQFVADEAQSAATAVAEEAPAKPRVDNPDA